MSTLLKLLEQAQQRHRAITVTAEQYEQWQQLYTFERIGGGTLSYSESFCNYFNLTDHVLCFLPTRVLADNYIRKHYVK